MTDCCGGGGASETMFGLPEIRKRKGGVDGDGENRRLMGGVERQQHNKNTGKVQRAGDQKGAPQVRFLQRGRARDDGWAIAPLGAIGVSYFGRTWRNLKISPPPHTPLYLINLLSYPSISQFLVRCLFTLFSTLHASSFLSISLRLWLLGFHFLIRAWKFTFG